MSSVNSISGLYPVPPRAILFVISCYFRPRYNGIYIQYLECFHAVCCTPICSVNDFKIYKTYLIRVHCMYTDCDVVIRIHSDVLVPSWQQRSSVSARYVLSSKSGCFWFFFFTVLSPDYVIKIADEISGNFAALRLSNDTKWQVIPSFHETHYMVIRGCVVLYLAVLLDKYSLIFHTSITSQTLNYRQIIKVHWVMY